MSVGREIAAMTLYALEDLDDALDATRAFLWPIDRSTWIKLAVVVFFYAPRSPGLDRPGLWKALGGQFGTLPQVVEMATVDSMEKAVGHWVGGGKQEHAYLPYLGSFLKTLGLASGGLALLSVVGFFKDRYGGDRPRDLVAIGFYMGVASLLGYPIAVDIQAAWTLTNVVVFLALPAAAGIALFVRWGREAYEGGDRVSLGLAALGVVLLCGAVLLAAVIAPGLWALFDQVLGLPLDFLGTWFPESE